MRHMQVNLIRGDRRKVAVIVTREIRLLYGGSTRIRPELAVSERKIRNRQSCMLVAHGRAKNQLGKDQHGRTKHHWAKGWMQRDVQACHRGALPPNGKKNGDGRHEQKKELGKRRVENP